MRVLLFLLLPFISLAQRLPFSTFENTDLLNKYVLGANFGAVDGKVKPVTVGALSTELNIDLPDTWVAFGRPNGKGVMGNPLFVYNNGNVGVNTATPTRKFVANGGSLFTQSTYNSSIPPLVCLNGYETVPAGVTANYDVFQILSLDAPGIRIKDVPDNTELAIGCGDNLTSFTTTSPYFRFYSAAPQNTPAYLGLGSVQNMVTLGLNSGFGVHTPSEKLEVNGRIKQNIVDLDVTATKIAVFNLNNVLSYRNTGDNISSVTTNPNLVGNGFSTPLDLANVGTAGTYNSVTTDPKGRVISGTNVPIPKATEALNAITRTTGTKDTFLLGGVLDRNTTIETGVKDFWINSNVSSAKVTREFSANRTKIVHDYTTGQDSSYFDIDGFAQKFVLGNIRNTTVGASGALRMQSEFAIDPVYTQRVTQRFKRDGTTDISAGLKNSLYTLGLTGGSSQLFYQNHLTNANASFVNQSDGNGYLSSSMSVTSGSASTTAIKIQEVYDFLFGTSTRLFIEGIPTADNNVQAGLGGIQVNQIYKSSTGELRIRY